MKHSSASKRSLNTKQGFRMKSKLIINDLEQNAPKASSIARQLENAESFSEGFSDEEGESHKLLGITTQMVADVAAFEENLKKSKTHTNRSAAVEAYFNINPSLLPEGNWNYADEKHVEILALFVESMKEDKATSTGSNYVKKQGVTAILQGYSTKSGRWYALTKSFDDKTKITFSYDVETLCNTSFGFACGLKTKSVKQARFDLATKSTTFVNNSMSVIAADLLQEGYVIDGKMFRVVLISNAFNYWIGEVDSYKMVMKDGAWVREEMYIWDQGVEVAPGVVALPATTDTSAAIMELKAMEADIQIGAGALTSNTAMNLADADEHMSIVAELDYIAYMEARAKVKVETKSIKVNNVLRDNADAASVIEAVWFIAQSEGDVAAIGILEQYAHMATDLWKVFFAFKTQTGNQLSFAVFNKLKTMATEAKLAKAEQKLMEVCTDEVKGLILRINAGEEIALDGAQSLAVFEAACAGERITNASLFKAIKIKAIAHRENLVA
jgi:hypothetical protein